jgi:hypothetical protein
MSIIWHLCHVGVLPCFYIFRQKSFLHVKCICCISKYGKYRAYHLKRNPATVTYCSTKMKSEAGLHLCNKIYQPHLWQLHQIQGHPSFLKLFCKFFLTKAKKQLIYLVTLLSPRPTNNCYSCGWILNGTSYILETTSMTSHIALCRSFLNKWCTSHSVVSR